MVNERFLREAKGENPSAVSAKFNKLHQRLIPQFVVHNVSGPAPIHHCADSKLKCKFSIVNDM